MLRNFRLSGCQGVLGASGVLRVFVHVCMFLLRAIGPFCGLIAPGSRRLR